MAARDYGAAVTALNSLQTNFAVIEAIRKSGKRMNSQAIPEMIEWTRKAGYEPKDLNRIKPIHIAGTKGKGSTSAFISSILSQYRTPSTTGGQSLQKIGLYTSPHIRFVRERIQINNQPLSEAEFAKYFFEMWDRLGDAAEAQGRARDDQATRPAYFRYLTLMAFHVYMSEGIDTAIIECGIGGEHDSTNIIVSPTVTAVTSLGIDHVNLLGSTLPDIAWHKAGIFKQGVLAFTAPQPGEALEVLQKRAAEKGAQLTLVNLHPELSSLKLGLAGEFQKINASVAIAVAAAHLRSLGYIGMPDARDWSATSLPPEFRRGLEQVRWPGRCEVRREASSHIAWHIDGAHTLESVQVAGSWFAQSIRSTTNTQSTPRPSRRPRILLFNQQTRDAPSLAKALHHTLAISLASTVGSAEHPFTHAVFCTNVTYADSGYRPDQASLNTNAHAVDALTVQNELARTWAEIDSGTEVKVVRAVQQAVEWCREIANREGNGEEVNVFVTGSLHLVGGVIEVLEAEKEKA